MKTSSRDKRAARHQVQAMKRGALDELTEDAEELGLYDDSPLTLKDDFWQDLRQPWQMPETKEE